MLRTLALAAITFATIATLAPEAGARPRPVHRKSNFQANKTFGLGIMLGSPTGLSGKYFVGPSTAIDFGVGGIGCCRGRSGIHLHGDFLWHPVNLTSTPPFELPLYVGIGGRFFSYEWRHGDHYHDGSALGVRVPLGIAFDFNNVPLDIFVELALVGDFLISRDDLNDNFDRTGLYVDVDGAVGIRYWFK
ncbi:MAG: hypothetical protein IPL61_38075 [Myxococcales bacterium]|nr:hypothetical protein [Myxococcales bacterium]